MGKKITKEDFIKRAKRVHGNKYDYSKTEYKNIDYKVCIICPEHGEFWQTPYVHLKGHGCPKCSGCHNFTTEEWIEKARKIHGDKYDYSKVKYKNQSTKVCIICPEHGEFWQIPNNHLNGKGCQKCKCNFKLTKEDFSKKAKIIHNDKYDYSNVNYVNNHTKVCIVCPEHGEFWQTPSDHLSGYGCPICGGTKRMTTLEFIEKARKVHGDKYDYSKVDYIDSKTKICIICPKHGEFWQTPAHHLFGNCCPKCKTSKLENKTMEMLLENNIKFVHQATKKMFPWLNSQKIDIYLKDYNIAIECQGEQHFLEIEMWGGKQGLKKRIELDCLKKQKCESNGIKLVYVGSEAYAKKYNLLTIKELENLLKYGDKNIH